MQPPKNYPQLNQNNKILEINARLLCSLADARYVINDKHIKNDV